MNTHITITNPPLLNQLPNRKLNLRNTLVLVLLLFTNVLLAQTPTITSFTPESGPVGTSVTITGTNFDTTPLNNTVFVGGVKAIVTAAAATELTITIPQGTTYTPITVLANGLMASSSKPFIVTFTGPAISANTFASKVDFPTGSGSWPIASGDLDGDGKPDLVTSNINASTMTVLHNTSAGGNVSFATEDFTTGATPISVSLGDLDGDGKLDIAVANLGGNTVSVFRNTSTTGTLDANSFAAKVDFTTGTQPRAVTIADLDGDGKPELAVANAISNSVSVFKNTSTFGEIDANSFATKVDFTTGAAYFVTVGDLDGDGKPDIACVNYSNSAGTISVLRSTVTTGVIDVNSFAAKVDFTSGGTQSFQMSLGDFDGDGKIDMAAPNRGTGNISLLRNASTPGVINASSFETKVDFAAGPGPYSVNIGDIDGDGKLDLSVPNQVGSIVYVFRNTSTSGTIDASSFAASIGFGTGQASRVAAIVDLNGDNKPDMALANNNSANVTVLRQKSPDTDILTFTLPEQTSDATVNAVNQTVDIEVIFGSDLSSLTPTFSLSVGADATVSAASQTSGATANNFASPVTYTINSEDGLATQDWTVSVSVAPAPTITSFSPASGPVGTNVVITGTGFNPTPANNIVKFGAVQAQVVAASATALTVTLPTGASHQPISILSNGLQAFASAPFIPIFKGADVDLNLLDPKLDLTTGTNPEQVAVGDLDGDGKADLAVANWASSTVSVFRNTSVGDGTVSYAPKQDFATATNPISISIADLDGDGKADLAVAARNSDAISVLLNTSPSVGTISYAPKQDFTTAQKPVYVSIGDLDGDGRADLVASSELDGTVSVLRNTSIGPGSISYAPKTDLAVAATPYGIAIADLDADGLNDIVVADFGGSTISILRNTSPGSGTISYAPKMDVTAGSQPISIAASDLDGDGKIDLAVANLGGNVSVLRNTSSAPSSISYAPKMDYATGDQPYSVALSDLDGDGKVDLAVANRISGNLTLLENTSQIGNISFETGVNFTTGTFPVSVVGGDLNGDGKPDLAVANRTSGTLSIFRNSGVRTPPTISSFTPTSGPIGTSVTITGAAFDSDPSKNIVFFGAAEGSVTAATPTEIIVTVPAGTTYDLITVLKNELIASTATPFIVTYDGANSIGPGEFVPKEDYTTGFGPSDVAMADLNGDGKPDLVVTNQSSHTVSILRNTSLDTDAITYAGKVDFATDTNPVSVSLSDFDGDGKMDLAVSTLNNTVSILRNTDDGSGAISFASKIDYETGFSPWSVSAGDFDSDGNMDIATANYNSNTISILRNASPGIGTINFESKDDFTTGTGPFSISTGDFDGDGKIDLAVANSDAASASVFRNIGSGSGFIDFSPKSDFTTGASPRSIAAGDLDNDGKIDLVVSGTGVSVLRNTSSGSGNIAYASKADFSVGSEPRKVSIGDLNGDGKVDLVTANETNPGVDGSITLLENSSSGPGNIAFASEVGFTTGVSPRAASLGDLNGDGKADIAVVNHNSSSLSVFRNARSEADILAFTLPGQSGSTTINATGNTVDINVPYDTDITSLIATFTLSGGAEAVVGSTSQTSGVTTNDFTNTASYTVRAEDAQTVKVWDINLTILPNTETDILTFVLAEQTAPATINATNHTVEIEVATGTDVSALVPTITLSAGATSAPASAVAQNFASTVTYTVTADDAATTQVWDVTVAVAPNTETDILTFVLAEQTTPATISATNHTVEIEVAIGTDVSALVPTITLSAGATSSPTTAVAQNFASPVTYAVTAEDAATTQDWEVTVTVAPSIETDILTFTLADQTAPATINATNHTVVIEVATGTKVNALVPTITLSEGATITPAEGVAQDFSEPVVYTVTAANTVTVQNWTVTVTAEESPLSIGSQIEFQIYPNPAGERIHIVGGSPENMAQVLSPSGKILSTHVVTAPISLTGLNPGVYLLKVYSGKLEIEIFRFIKK